MAPSSTPPPIREAWILAGTIDGVPAFPTLDTVFGGIPYLTRLVCDVASAGASQIYVVWCGDARAPDLSDILADERIVSRGGVSIVTSPPGGAPDDAVLVVRADRVYHREVPKVVAQAWHGSSGVAGRVRGSEYDAVVATRRLTAAKLCAAAAGRPGAIAAEFAEVAPGDIAEADPPYLGFCMPARDASELRTATTRLVYSLRKSADGIAAKLFNRRVSLPITRVLANTSIHPNQVTLIALACALAGGAVISRGGYLAGLVGMLLVELGSIVDGIDGELARLRFQFSRRGQWLDTVVDDVGNVAYSTGVMISLDLAGVTWAVPVGVAAIFAFAITQATQYWLILRVYRSGDLAAIPWAFQSSEFLSQQPRGAVAWIKATVPKLLKRDFVVTLFVALAAIGHLELVLGVFIAGAFTFFVVLFTQLARNRQAIAAAMDVAR